jgi:membrane fusion protein, multidrug efflux system
MRQLTKAKVDFTLPEQYSNMIKIGGIVEIEVDAANSQRERAKIIAMEPEANRQTRNVVVRAALERDIPNPGAFVKVYVGSLGGDKRAIMVPTNTIIPDDKNNQVIIVKGGKANFVNVTTGTRTESNVEITEGINEGDSVVVTGVLFARPNSVVRVRSVKTLDQLGTAR